MSLTGPETIVLQADKPTKTATPAAKTGTVCAIVPTFNRSAMLAECLQSLLAQTRVPDRIIVVDDGSTDDTPAVAAAFGPPVEVYSKANGGKAAALNFALALSREDYVWICDDDDIAAPDACRTLAGALDANPGAAFAYGKHDRFVDAPEGRRTLPPSYWPGADQTDLFLAFAERFFAPQFSCLVRRSAYLAAGPFREDLIRSQDYEMALRLSRSGRGVEAPGILFHQRMHQGARGAASDRFDAREAEARWLSYDAAFFSELLPTLSEDELVPAFARGADEAVRKRAARLQLACIEAKHALWDEATEHLSEACALGADWTPLPGELALAGRMLADDLPAERLLQGPAGWRQRLRACHSAGRYGRAVIRAMQGPARWKSLHAVKTGDRAMLARSLRIALAAVGPAGLVSVFLRKPDQASSL